MKKKLTKDRHEFFRPIRKGLLIMRLFLVLMILGVFYSNASVSQSKLFNISEKNVSVKEVLDLIEKQSEYRFFYEEDKLNVKDKLDFKISNSTIEEVLILLSKENEIDYKILDDNFIVLKSKNGKTGSSFFDSKQEKTITGSVSDSSGAPLPGVAVVIKGTTVGTITDFDGNYTINAAEGRTLVFSFLGMTDQEVQVGSSSTINVTLTTSVVDVDEVVVVGYGTTKKVTTTGSTITAKGETLKRSPATNVANTLVGQLPGLVSVQRSGEPGNDGSTLRIRGTNTLETDFGQGNDYTNAPLVVVDGVASRGFERIDPSDIESITVLKDASAAIYGSQAANGVILVTTKRGKLGKPKVTINLNVGSQQPSRVPDMADAAQYATMLNELEYYKNTAGGRNQIYTDEEIQKFRDGSDPWGYPNTNWYDEVLKKNSLQSYQNVSISGGTENLKYFLSLGAKYQDGLYNNSGTNYNQYDFRSNIDAKISKDISVALDLSGRQEVRNYPTRDSYSIFRALTRGKPNMHAYWPDGTPGPDIENGDNPAISSTSATGYNKEKVYTLQTNLRTNINIPWIRGLSVTANASFDKMINFQKIFETPWYLYSWDGNADHITVKGKRGLASPQLTESMSDGLRVNLNAYATYETRILDTHNLKVMVGAERRNGLTDEFEAFRKNFLSSEIDQLFAGATDEFMTNDGSATQYALRSYFGRLNYDFMQKYLFEFVWRYDGSHKFPKDTRYGFFPGFSAGWRVSEENFWNDNFSFINNFKLRGSWGQTGNDRIPDYSYLATYNFLGNRTMVFGGNENKVLNEARIPNPIVTWEVATQTNIGLDAGFLDQKFYLTLDLFNNNRTQILVQRNASVPASTGLTLPPENIGKVNNKGFEGVLGYTHRTNDFGIDVSINGSYSKNKIVFWDETPGIPEYQQSTGKPVGASLYYNAIGVFKDQADLDAYPHWAGAEPGDVIFEDYNKDGKIDADDRVRREKTAIPTFIGGLNINITYKNFDLALLFQGATGAESYLDMESGEFGNYYKVYADNRWTPENTSADSPRSWNRDDYYWRGNRNTFWLLNTNYIRLKNMEIGYNVPKKINQKLGFENLRIYLNGMNLLTLDKAKLIDPEIAGGNSYPISRIVNGGITLTF